MSIAYLLQFLQGAGASAAGGVVATKLSNASTDIESLLVKINTTLQDGFNGLDPRSEDLKREIKSLNSHLSGGGARLEEKKQYEKRMRNSPVGERLGK